MPQHYSLKIGCSRKIQIQNPKPATSKTMNISYLPTFLHDGSYSNLLLFIIENAKNNWLM